MLMGVSGLVIRFVLYAVGAGMAGAGLATFSLDNSSLCVDMLATAGRLSEVVGMIAGGTAMFSLSALWSRVVKREGGVT